MTSLFHLHFALLIKGYVCHFNFTLLGLDLLFLIFSQANSIIFLIKAFKHLNYRFHFKSFQFAHCIYFSILLFACLIEFVSHNFNKILS